MEQQENNQANGDKSWFKYIFAGTLFGIIAIKSEIISWFRIQEMFRFQAIHMYGIMGSAVVVGVISILIIKKFGIKSIQGDKIEIAPKQYSKGLWIGGFIFGLGWAITGACPGPLYAQIGSGNTIVIITLLSAILGTWLYGLVEKKLP